MKNGKEEPSLSRALMLTVRKMAEGVSSGPTAATTMERCKTLSSMVVELDLWLSPKRPTKANSNTVSLREKVS